MKFRNIVNRFKSDTEGNVSLMFAASFVMSLTLIGAVFDLMLINKSKQHAQYLTDAAVLAALQFEGTAEEREDAFAEYIRILNRLSTGEELDFTSSVDIQVVEGALIMNADVSIQHELIMLQHLGAPPVINIHSRAEKGIEDIEIALVLDISTSMAGERITEAKAAANLFIDQLLSDQEFMGRISISLVPFGGTVRVPAELSNLLNAPLADLEDFSHNWIGGEWNQCFEFDAIDTANGISPTGAYRPIMDFTSTRQDNPWCPISGNELVPLNNNKEMLTAKVDSLSLSDGTGSDQGMAWGFETLNPAWRNKFPDAKSNTPADLTDKTQKIIVYMSDGAISPQYLVRNRDQVGEPPYDSRKRIRIRSSDTLNSFFSACDRAKESKIDVYTIGFNLTRASDRSTLEDCATAPSHYIDAQTGDLQGVFANIAKEISPLRVTN